jgi:hypothetical protein
MPVIQISLHELNNDSDWAQVFADENAGNVSKAVHKAPPNSDVSDAEFSRSDVKEIVAAVNGGYDELDWLGVFLLNDGRYAIAAGGCDYTGWD